MAQYIVAPKSRTKERSNELLQFLHSVEKRSDVSIERTVGESSHPRRLVIRTTPDVIEDLQSYFGDRLIIELDSDLQMFS